MVVATGNGDSELIPAPRHTYSFSKKNQDFLALNGSCGLSKSKRDHSKLPICSGSYKIGKAPSFGSHFWRAVRVFCTTVVPGIFLPVIYRGNVTVFIPGAGDVIGAIAPVVVH